MLVHFGTKCQSVSIYIYVTKYRTMYVVLNEYVTGCISYDTNMYHIMIGVCHISGTKITFGCVNAKGTY